MPPVASPTASIPWSSHSDHMNRFKLLKPLVMKRTPLLALLFIMLGLAAPAQPADFWINQTVITAPPDIPPQIDALNFVNSNSMTIVFTNFLIVNPELFDTS